MAVRHGEVVVFFGDDDHTFRLGLGELAEIEERFDCSILVLATKLSTGTAKSTEIFEIIRVGLVGGGMNPVSASRLVQRYGDARPLEESRLVALSVAMAALLRVYTQEAVDPPAGEPSESPNASTSEASSDTPS